MISIFAPDTTEGEGKNEEKSGKSAAKSDFNDFQLHFRFDLSIQFSVLGSALDDVITGSIQIWRHSIERARILGENLGLMGKNQINHETPTR